VTGGTITAGSGTPTITYTVTSGSSVMLGVTCDERSGLHEILHPSPCQFRACRPFLKTGRRSGSELRSGTLDSQRGQP
jgi:hypothetical protein